MGSVASVLASLEVATGWAGLGWNVVRLPCLIGYKGGGWYCSGDWDSSKHHPHLRRPATLVFTRRESGE